MKQGILSMEDALALYGDMPLAQFVNKAVQHGLIPLNLQFKPVMPVDELVERPQVYTVASFPQERIAA